MSYTVTETDTDVLTCMTHSLLMFDRRPANLEGNEDAVKVVTGKAYRELCEWIKPQDFNMTSLVMKKTRDANGVVDWVSPHNSMAWVRG